MLNSRIFHQGLFKTKKRCAEEKNAYLINLKPELMIDGEIVATGTSVGMGNTEDFKMTFTAPNMSSDLITNNIEAGEYLGIGLDLGRISQKQMEDIKSKLETLKTKLELEDFENLSKDDFLGEFFYTTALSYYAELDVIDSVTASSVGIIAIRLPSETIFSTELSVNKFFGSVMSAGGAGMAMDLDRAMTLVKALDGDLYKPKQFMLASGKSSSTLEHSVPEQMFSTTENPAVGISAVKALKIANDQGIPIYTINQDNMGAVLPQLQLDAGIIADIQNAVNAGMIVIAPQVDITFNGWTGSGYIIQNPETGAGAYMISGGLNGAVIVGTILLLIGMMFLAILAAVPAAYSVLLPLVFFNIFAGIYLLYGEDTFIEFADCFDSSLTEIVTDLVVAKHQSQIIYEILRVAANKTIAKIAGAVMVIPMITRFGYCMGYVLWGGLFN